LPSIEQVLPWLEQLFDAWDERRRQREHEAAERAALDAAVQEPADPSFDAEDDDADSDEPRKKKKKKKRDRKDD
jgi:hypothetical protein